MVDEVQHLWIARVCCSPRNEKITCTQFFHLLSTQLTNRPFWVSWISITMRSIYNITFVLLCLCAVTLLLHIWIYHCKLWVIVILFLKSFLFTITNCNWFIVQSSVQHNFRCLGFNFQSSFFNTLCCQKQSLR